MRADVYIELSEIRFTATRAEDEKTGLLGFVDCVLNGAIRLSGMTVRRTGDGRLTLSYPSRIDAKGRKRFLFHPIHDGARQEIERQVIAALGHLEGT